MTEPEQTSTVEETLAANGSGPPSESKAKVIDSKKKNNADKNDGKEKKSESKKDADQLEHSEENGTAEDKSADESKDEKKTDDINMTDMEDVKAEEADDVTMLDTESVKAVDKEDVKMVDAGDIKNEEQEAKCKEEDEVGTHKDDEAAKQDEVGKQVEAEVAEEQGQDEKQDEHEESEKKGKLEDKQLEQKEGEKHEEQEQENAAEQEGDGLQEQEAAEREEEAIQQEQENAAEQEGDGLQEQEAAEREEEAIQQEHEENENFEGDGKREDMEKQEEHTDKMQIEEDKEGDSPKAEKVEEDKEGGSSRKKRSKGQKPTKKGETKKEFDKKVKELSSPIVSSSDRPVRKRKTVKRLVEVVEKKPRKEFQVEKGRGTALKDIPSVVYKLARKKPSDIKLIHQTLFGRKGKVADFKTHILQFSGFVWNESDEKQRAKMKGKLDKYVKDTLLELCDLFDISVSRANSKKEDLVTKLLDFLVAPHATSDVLSDKDQSPASRKRKRTAKGSSSKSAGSTPTSQSRKKLSKCGGTPNKRGKRDRHVFKNNGLMSYRDMCLNTYTFRKRNLWDGQQILASYERHVADIYENSSKEEFYPELWEKMVEISRRKLHNMGRVVSSAESAISGPHHDEQSQLAPIETEQIWLEEMIRSEIRAVMFELKDQIRSVFRSVWGSSRPLPDLTPTSIDPSDNH